MHTKRSRDIIRMGPETLIQLCQQIRQTELGKDGYRSTWKNNLPNFSTLLDIM